MTRPTTDCSRFLSRLDAWLAGDLDDVEAARAEAHLAACAACRTACAEAADADAALAAWEAPDPPAGLRERILLRVRADRSPSRVTCVDLRADVDAWLAGDLPDARDGHLRAHVDGCPPCAHELRVARGVEELLGSWAAPEPPAGLKQQLLDLHVRSERALRLAGVGGPARRPRAPSGDGARASFPSLPRRAALAAAAAILVTTAFVLLEMRRDAPSGAGERHRAAPPVQDLLERYGGDVRVRAVATQQYPASVGRFSGRPAVTELRRSSGNRFHRSLRRVLSSGDPPGEGR